MNKRPDKRITIEKIKQHDFFKGFDFDKLLKKEIQPPIVLQAEDIPDDEDNEENQFLKLHDRKFKDRDYTD